VTERTSSSSAVSVDALHQQMVVNVLAACERWARCTVDVNLNVLIWPRDRGPIDQQEMPMRVTQQTIERGIWRLVLCPASELPAGASLAARNEALKAQWAGSAMQTPHFAIDEVVQCGLFGEVLYP
jgi:hypothetical protein